MKVGIYLTNRIPIDGGGFSYVERLVQAIDNHEFGEQLAICFVGRMHKKHNPLKKAYYRLAPPIIYSLSRFLSKFHITSFLSKFYINVDVCNIIDRSRLKKNNVDLLLYPKQTLSDVDDFPFISMNWDIGNESCFAFPEFSSKKFFYTRNNWYKSELLRALGIFVESESGKKELLKYLPYSENKIEVVPLCPGKVVDLSLSEDQQKKSLSKYNLSKGQFFFYPAQFWAHKNHYNLLIAFKQLGDVYRNNGIKLVLTGYDKGNRNYIVSVIKENGLEDNVVILGFVSNEEIYSLYKNAIALVMPTFLGPTNMPLLEAQALNTLIICSDFEGHREICGDGALYVDPEKQESITEKLRLALDKEKREEIIKKANDVAKSTPFTIQKTITRFESALRRFVNIRKAFE